MFEPQGDGEFMAPRLQKRLITRNARNLTTISQEVVAKGNPGTVYDYRSEFSKDYASELDRAIELNSRVSAHFFILVARRTMHGLEAENIYRQLFIGCHVRPQAEPNTDCWEIDCASHTMDLLWVLPTRVAIQQLAVFPPSNADPFLVHSCKEFINGNLNREYERILAAGARSKECGVQLARDEGGAATSERRESATESQA